MTATSTRKITWTMASGKTAEAIINVTRGIESRTAYADGDMVEISGMAVDRLTITVNVDGALVVEIYDAPTVILGTNDTLAAKVEAMGGYSIIGKIVLERDVHDRIMAAIADAQAEAGPLKADLTSGAYVEIPDAAIAAYDRYDGDAEAAWEAEDAEACMLIREWGGAIEANETKIRIGG